MVPPTNLRQSRLPTARLPLRVAGERGFTLVETLTVAALLILVLGAVATVSDQTRSRANADQKRTDTLDQASAGLARIVGDLGQACYLIAPGSAQLSGAFCRTPGTTIAASASTGSRTTTPDGPTTSGAESTACGPTATPATTQNNCLEFLMRGRTAIARDPSSGAVTGTTRTLWRVRYNCAIGDPRDPRGTNTRCERFSTPCVTSGASTSCPAPCSPSATSCTASGSSEDVVTTNAVTNSAETNPANIPRPIFLYCSRVNAQTCSATFSTAAAAIRVELAIARRGTLNSGLANSIDLKDAAELRNNVSDRDSRDDSPGA
jgi:type II secretory pathway pseudopilin PulG